MFEFFKTIGKAILSYAIDKPIQFAFRAATVITGVKGFLQAKEMLAKGQDIMANKTAAGGKIPVIYGTRRVGAQIVYMDTAQNRSKDLFVVYAISVGECEEILGKTIEIDGNSILDGNIYKGGGYVGSDKIPSGSGSLNTASQVGDNQYSNAGTLGTDPTLRYSFVFNLHHGADSQTADPMLRASIPTEWTTNHKLNGICYIAASFDYDKKGMYKGVPQITVQVKGKKVYDPRESNHTFGDPSTYEWSSNPALCFLDYITNDEYGKGLAESQINMTAIGTAADKCNTKVDQPYYNGSYQDVTWSGDSGDDFIVIDDNADWWQNKVDEFIDIRDVNDTSIFSDDITIKGSTRYEFYDATQENRLYIDGTLSSTYTNEAGSAKAQVKRFHCNGYIDTNKNVMDNAKELLANMRGILNYVNGKYELEIEDTGTSTFSITDDHIIADAGISVDYGNKDKKANKVVIEFFNANKKYELDTATVLHDATPEYYSDDGEVLEIKAEFPYVTDPYIAYNMGKAILTRSRNQTTMQFLGTPEMYKLNVGDIVDLTYSGLGFLNKPCRVEALELQANGLVSVSLIEYFDVYTWEVPAQESVEILAKIPTIGAIHPPEASSIVFTDTDASPINRPTLTWTEPTDFPVKEFRVDVVDSSDNNVFSKIVDTPSVDLSFLPKAADYEASITSFNGVGIESNASTITFTIADDPVKTTEVEIGSETLSNIIDYGTIAGGGTSNFFQINTRLDLEDRFIWNSNGTNDWSLGTGGDDDVNLYIEGSADKLITFKDQSSELGSVKLTFGDDVSGSYFADFITLEADWTNGYVTTGSGLSKFYIKGKGYDGSTASGTIATFQLTSANGYGIPLTELHGKTKTPILNLDQGTAPSTTTDLLYNVGGTLYWNGSSVNTGAGDITGVTITTSGQSGLTGGASFSSGDATFTLAIASTINGSKTFADDVVIEGDLTVQGTTTTIDTTNLDVKDKNITLNYSTGDSSASANGAGITIQDAVSATQDATLTWNTANDSFNFSHPLNVTGNISSSANVSAQSFTASSSGYGAIELGGVSGAYIDLKTPNTDDFDLRLITTGTGGQINASAGSIDSQIAGSTYLSVSTSGIDVTGTVVSDGLTVAGNTTFNTGDVLFTGASANILFDQSASALEFGDNAKAQFGTGADLQIYHDGSGSFIKDVGTGNLFIDATSLRLRTGAGTENYLVADGNGAVTIYYDNSPKLATTSTGIDVTGTISASNIINGLAYQVSGTEVISSSRNLTNIGTISSGEQTITSNTYTKIYSSTNGASSGLRFSDHAGGSYAQYGDIRYYHADGSSYGSGNAFVFTSSESTATILADGKLMFKEGLYVKPSSGTGAGTQIINSSRAFTNVSSLTLDSSGTSSTLNYGSNGSRTFSKVDAGASASQSGFFETASPTNYYSGASSWQHLMEARHSNNSNNYAMQIAGSFFDQDFYGRKTNNSATTAWKKFAMHDTDVSFGAITSSGVIKATQYEPYSSTSQIDYKGFASRDLIQAVDGAAYYYGSDNGGYGIVIQGGHPICKSVKIGSVNAGTTVITSSRSIENVTSISATGNIQSSEITTGAIEASYDKTNTSTPIITVDSLGNDLGQFIALQLDGTTKGNIGVSGSLGNDIYIASGTTNSAGFGLRFIDYTVTNAALPCRGDGSTVDNLMDLGNSGSRFDDIYATNGTINTSDRNEKQDIQALTEAEQRVATACKGLIRRFRWQDAVEKKGDDARYHFGVIAQDLQDAFEAEGLDAGDYGMFISSTWTDDDGNEQTRLGVRYNELLAFIISTL